jgi:hypothetical protein
MGLGTARLEVRVSSRTSSHAKPTYRLPHVRRRDAAGLSNEVQDGPAKSPQIRRRGRVLAAKTKGDLAQIWPKRWDKAMLDGKGGRRGKKPLTD